MNMEKFSVTEGSVEDVEILLRHREAIWREVSTRTPSEITDAIGTYREWLLRTISEGRLIPFVARDGRAIAGSGCLWIRDMHPRPGRGRHIEVCLVGIYTEPAYRRSKVASGVVESAIEWCRRNGIERLSLHSSEQGKGLYEKFGFQTTTEMRLNLN